MARIIQTANLTPYSNLSSNDNEWVYNGLDCCVTLEVLHALDPHLSNSAASTYAFERDLQAPVMEMSLRGIRVNQERRNRVLASYRSQSERAELALQRLVREGIGLENGLNWRSPAQLISFFYDVMGLPVHRKRNANGVMAPTVNREAIEKLTVNFLAEPICLHLLFLRDLGKKISFLETGIDADGRMRSSFNIAGTNTGRLSSSTSIFGTGTNQQNVDRELRSVFMADPGYKFCNIDLSQGDSRNLGALCWEHFLDDFGEAFAGCYLDACESGDLHTTVCRMARPHLPWTGDAKLDRAIADRKAYRNDSYRDLDKKLGHGSNYLGAPFTMAKHSKVPRKEVEVFQSNYFRGFPCIPQYHSYVRSALLDFGSLTTLYGRTRHFFGRVEDMATIREAVAYCPQSMTADAIDTGMLKIWRANRVQILCQVHDSLLIQYKEAEEQTLVPWIIETLPVYFDLKRGRRFSVPAEAKVGWNWGDVTYNKDGTIGDNPDGLVKWKGVDDRKRAEVDGRLTIRGR
jgi:DNA polymerase-1